MKLNQLNKLPGDPEKDEIIKLANRIKALRLRAGHLNYEKFALGNGIARIQYRNYEMGGNITYKSLLKVLAALNVTITEFFSEGFD
ncbi:helix-turn-helix domain-containing protein [Mucilaginibacter sp. BJC16-A38]|uniref:helix-turn-helix domain-containing protein n=1 Tax=Mucilaginibacter phenanthrenivorans TaxID=1234842 RepID=UPI0021571663|nr:helix-turn-helix domain-containing protein [Mucilaginibacter phenanthrenivorans]MCR8556924.1 helix-turn-helix domain-containing protein [Mucilaginibacter phenanthrenivorans]